MEGQSFLFLLDGVNSLVMDLQITLDKVDCCYEAAIVLVHNKEKVLLCHQPVRDSVYALRVVLEDVLKKQLFLHESINCDIGYLYNEYSHCMCIENSKIKDTFFYEMLDNTSIWVGMRYYLWAGNDFISWLYNDVEGNIVFEITPFYPYMYPDAEKELYYMPYEKWIKNYKPYLIQKILSETAQQWLDQAIYIADYIDSNITRWQKEGRVN